VTSSKTQTFSFLLGKIQQSCFDRRGLFGTSQWVTQIQSRNPNVNYFSNSRQIAGTL